MCTNKDQPSGSCTGCLLLSLHPKSLLLLLQLLNQLPVLTFCKHHHQNDQRPPINYKLLVPQTIWPMTAVGPATAGLLGRRRQ